MAIRAKDRNQAQKCNRRVWDEVVGGVNVQL